VILSYQRADLGELDAHLWLRELLHPNFRVRVVDNRNVVNDEALFAGDGVCWRRRRVERPLVTVLLAGEARVRAFGREHWLAAGDVSIASAVDKVELREQGERFRSLSFEWEPSFGFGTASPETLDAASIGAPALGSLRAIAERLLDRDLSAPEAAAKVRDALSVLSAEGISVTPTLADALVAEPSPQDVCLARALDKALSCLRERPMVVDLERELDVSARHVTRLVSSFNARYDSGATNWRDVRRRRRLTVGTVFMTREGATAELVAKRVGYASGSAFCRALGTAGLPTPTRVRDAVRALA
jgi:hypothetical protein